MAAHSLGSPPRDRNFFLDGMPYLIRRTGLHSGVLEHLVTRAGDSAAL